MAAAAALHLPLLTLGMPAAAAELEPTVSRISGQLKAVWQQDPLTAPWPVPVPELLPPGRTPSQVCPDSTGLRAATAALHCSGSGKVLLERGKVKISHEIYKEGGVAFWIALGMAQALPIPAAERAESGAPAAAASLQRLCLAGTMLGAMPLRDPSAQRKFLRQSVKMARVAYVPSLASEVGTPGQRAYALLTGTGCTRLTCSGKHMRQLAAGDVPDQELISRLAANRDPSVGIEDFCRQPPECPRGLRSSMGVGVL